MTQTKRNGSHLPKIPVWELQVKKEINNGAAILFKIIIGRQQQFRSNFG